ncbi:hypothetical protein WMY93_011876 [Mugilogobius chulae]|uniref:Disks large-associated protein 4 n=1 Tax=Mugilogobius chulae TaxID=88201 RepID=A0AAW0P3X5_9GOBI
MSSCLPSLQELSSSPRAGLDSPPRSLEQIHSSSSLGGDRLDSAGGTVSSGWDDDDLREAVSSLARRRRMGQLRDLDSGPFEDHSSESTFRDSRSQSQDSPPDLPSDLPPDLPRPSCFRSRSHSYLRAIQAGCSQDEDSLSLDSTSPPPTESSLRTYSTSTVSTCVSTSKRTAPPPVPPRTTSKPYISVTVQSSTESAQDTYLEREEGRRSEVIRSEVTSQSSQAHSNSSDSLDSTRANSLARGIRRPPQITATTRENHQRENHQRDNHQRENHQRENYREQQRENYRENYRENQRDNYREHRELLTQRETREAIGRSNAATETTDCESDATKAAKANLTLTGAAKANIMLTPEEPQEAPAPRRKLSSIGIQVDCMQEASSPAPERTRPLSAASSPSGSKWRTAGRAKVMVSCGSQSVAQDSLEQEEPAPSTPPITRQILNRSTTRSSSDSFSESLDPALDPALDPSCLPPPDPWLESGVSGGSSSGGGGGALSQAAGGNLCKRDGQWFLKLLEAERGRMEGWCEQMEQETQDHQLSQEVLEKVRSAMDSAQILMSQKFQQFQGLCEQNLDPQSSSRPSPQDLAGFWDLLQISIEDISLKFDELYHLKSNEWQPLERKDHQERPTAAVRKPAKGRSPLAREKSADSSSIDKLRPDARKRIANAKKAASFRQNSATESADSLEMYVPEAQTRL